LPRTAGGQIERRIERVQPAPLPQHEATILVVDDDSDVRQLAVSCLESLGYRALAADGGKAAVEAIGNTRVDMVLIDIAMPEINGVEALATMLKKRPDLPYLYMTGYVGPTTLDPSEQRVLKKPFTVAELAIKVEQVLFPTARRRQENNNVVLMKNPKRDGLGTSGAPGA
jgi:two-component system cell cycle sensor histidine kinase/response regulator CckA